MSFVCGYSNRVQEDGTKAVKIVTQVRKVTYPPIRDERGNVVRIPEGYETVKEITVSPEYANLEFRVEVVGEKIIAEKLL